MGDDLSNSLVGRVVRDVTHDYDEIVFDTDDGPVVWGVYGDCCSSSWIEHAETDLIRGRVHAVEEIEMGALPSGSPDTRHDDLDYRVQDCTALYGIKIHTDGGTGMIEFRNSSNGYYSGWMAVTKRAKDAPCSPP